MGKKVECGWMVGDEVGVGTVHVEEEQCGGRREEGG